MMIKYCVMYPQAENIHLIKDVGMIAYKLFKLFDYEASIACYNNGSYEYLDNEVKGLRTSFIEKKFNNDIIDGVIYLKNNAKNINVLQLFHITLRTVFYTFAFKFFNPKGKIFLKLDCTNRLIDVIKSLNKFKFKLLTLFLNKVDIIGVEQSGLYEELKEVINKQSQKLLLIPNGIDFESSSKYNDINFTNKQNIILHVGRIGSPEKATDVLLNAISKISGIENSTWKIIMVGPIEENFKSYIDNFFNSNEGLKNIIEFKGPIYDREELFEEYKKAKIFCLSSKYESFGIALLEAASFGDVIISTDVGIAKEIVGFNNGAIVKVGDIEMLSSNIRKLMFDTNLEKCSKITEAKCRNKFDWNNIVAVLNKKLLEVDCYE